MPIILINSICELCSVNKGKERGIARWIIIQCQLFHLKSMSCQIINAALRSKRLIINHMKLYLLILALIVSQFSAFRVLRRDSLALPDLPDSISFLAADLLVVQSGSFIQVYNTTSKRVVQNFTSDSAEPDVQVAPQSNMILFKNNRSIFQLQKVRQNQTYDFQLPETFWVYRPAITNNVIISHEFSFKGLVRQVTYLNTTNNKYRRFNMLEENGNMLYGSRVVAFSPDEYYFLSGGISDPNSQVSDFFLFMGNSEGISLIKNVSVSGFVNSIVPGQRMEWRFSSADIGSLNRLHLVTFVMDAENDPRVQTTRVLTSNSGFISDVTSFVTKRLIGVNFIDQSIYTADDLLCRVVEHTPEYYQAAITSESALGPKSTKLVVSQDESLVLQLTSESYAYLLSASQEGTYQTALKISHPQAPTFTKGFFSNDSSLVLLSDSLNQAYVLDNPNGRFYPLGTVPFKDHCIADNSLVYAATQSGQTYSLSVARIVSTSANFILEVISTTQLSFSVDSLLCLDDSVLIKPINNGEPISIWSYTNTFNNTGNLIKLANKHDKVYRNKNYIYFSNSDRHTTPLFYDYKLNPIILTNSILIAPETVYVPIQSNSEYIFLALGDDLTSLISVDQYQLISNSLMYIGSYPLIANGTSGNNRVIVLPGYQKISIDYDSNITTTYNLTSPPQEIRGIFYDNVLNDCSGYTNALFRLNTNTNKKEIIVVNGVTDTPILERYSFSDSSNILNKEGSAVLNGFVNGDLETELSPDRQSVVVSGTKQGIVETVEIRNANNLADTTFEHLLFDASQNKNLQAAVFFNNSIYSYTIDKFDASLQNETNHVHIESTATSGGKVSTGSDIGDISLFATCVSCNLVAAIGTNNSRIALVNINTGVTKSIIFASCPVTRLALSFDGSRLAYLCTNSSIFIYETTSDLNSLQASGFNSVTSMKILGNVAIVVVNNGIVNRIQIVASQLRNMMEVQTSLLASQNNSIAINSNLQLYAYSPSPQTVFIQSFSGSSNETYTLPANQEVLALAFSPDNTLTISLNDSSLIVLTPAPCAANSTQVGSDCICNPTFLDTGSSCQCGPFLSLSNDKCVCDDGQYFKSASECADCSVMCLTCSDEGVTGCDSYSAIFVVIIVVIFLLLAGVGILIFLKMQRTSKMEKIKSVARSHSKEQSEDLLIHQPLMKGESKEN